VEQALVGRTTMRGELQQVSGFATRTGSPAKQHEGGLTGRLRRRRVREVSDVQVAAIAPA
jgi:hypothetical protein